MKYKPEDVLKESSRVPLQIFVDVEYNQNFVRAKKWIATLFGLEVTGSNFEDLMRALSNKLAINEQAINSMSNKVYQSDLDSEREDEDSTAFNVNSTVESDENVDISSEVDSQEEENSRDRNF